MQLLNDIHSWGIKFNLLPDETICMPIVFLFELFAFLVIFILAKFYPRAVHKTLKKFLGILDEVGKRQILSIIIICLIAFLGNAMGNLLVRFPEPAIHDEFSKLLQADTFASGRLSNPSHPFWEHFKTFHILQQPTYASKYLPGQGLLLALGQIIGGHPVVGLWIGAAFLCVSIYWMLTGIIPKRWGILGSLLAALNFCVLGYWSQKYWGGYIAAASCSLVYGALFRIQKKVTYASAILLGVGLVLMAFSRPIESFFAIAPGGIYFFYLYLKDRETDWYQFFSRIILPTGIIVTIGMLWLGYYNYRVTGNALQLPYVLYGETSIVTPNFLWSETSPLPEGEMEEYLTNYQIHFAKFNTQKSISGYFNIKKIEFFTNILFYFRFVFLIPLLMIPFFWRKNWTSIALISVLIVWIVVFCQYGSPPRKIAPATGLMVLIIVQGLRVLICGQRGKNNLGNVLMFTVIAVFISSVAASFHPFFQSPPWYFASNRREIENVLKTNGGNHLIFVEYAKGYVPHFEFVQNGANIDASAVVWARKLSPLKNRELIQYYSNRKAWVLSVDQRGPIKLKPYSP